MAEPTQHTFPPDEGTPEEELEYLLGEASDLLQAGRLDDAKREIERALTLRPGHEQARNLLGLTLFRLGDLEPALGIFEGLVHDNPVEPSLRLNLAMVHLKAGRLTAAHEELERALDLNPDHKRAASYMAMVCERLERHAEAAEWYARAGNEAQAAAARARYARAGNEAQAAAARARAASQPSPDDGAAPPAALHEEDDAVPEPPPVLSSEGGAADELMPKPGARDVADGEVQAAALSALRAEALSRPPSPPSAADASSAREASREFTLDVDDEGAREDDGYVDPFEEEEPVESTRPYAPNPYFGAGGDVIVSVRDIATPTRREAEVSIAPVEVSPDDVELRALEPDDDAEPPAPAPSRASRDESRAVPAPVDTSASDEILPAASDAASAGRALPSLTLADLGARGANADATQPFLDDDGLVVFPVREAAYLRTDLLVGLRGSFEVEPVYRRYRGRRTDSFFGGSKSPLAAALGDGRAWLDPNGAEVTVLALRDEELYLVEGTLLAFTSGLVWENGRLPEQGGRDLDVVHLRGSGRVVLQTRRALRAIESGEQPVTVAAPRLVGWAGSLVPSRGLFPGLPDGVERPSIVRFEGNGRILVV